MPALCNIETTVQAFRGPEHGPQRTSYTVSFDRHDPSDGGDQQPRPNLRLTFLKAEKNITVRQNNRMALRATLATSYKRDFPGALLLKPVVCFHV
jgi:hypothetical protein